MRNAVCTLKPAAIGGFAASPSIAAPMAFTQVDAVRIWGAFHRTANRRPLDPQGGRAG